MSNPAEITLAGQRYGLTYDKAAVFRADDVGAWTGKAGAGFASACKFLWALGPATLRAKYPTPESLANDVPPIGDAWAAINAAMQAAGEGMAAKKLFGSTNGPSPSSS